MKIIKPLDIKYDKKFPVISVVLSFFNEEAVIPELIDRLKKVFLKLKKDKKIRDYELIFINDASTDESENLIIKEIKKNKNVTLINMSRNFGADECRVVGLEYAKGDAIVNMDTDLQDPPEVISQMIKLWQNDEKTEIVYTTRIKREGEHPLKLLITKFGYRFINSISDINLPVDSGDFKLISKLACQHILLLKEKKPYFRGLVSWVGFKQTQLMYEREPRFDGRHNSKFPVLSKRVIYAYFDRAMISHSDAPLKLTLFFGFLISCFSALYLIYLVFQRVSGEFIPGWPALMAAITFLGGIQILMIGVIGLYIGNIFLETKKRPNHIVKEIIRK
jgi:glycosyltransferase involved in cell wall biosynthesis